MISPTSVPARVKVPREGLVLKKIGILFTEKISRLAIAGSFHFLMVGISFGADLFKMEDKKEL